MKKDHNKKTESQEEYDVVESHDVEYAENSEEEQIKKLKKKLAQSEAQKQEYLDGWQRSQADFVNARRRAEEEKKSEKNRITEKIILDLLPVLDSFEMAIGNKSWSAVDQVWRQGVEYIHTKLKTTLENYTLSEIKPEPGDTFDPLQHHSLEALPGDEKQDGLIAERISKGYILNGHVVRPASVKVFVYQRH